ncbi:MAG: hypothetical protein KJO31_02090 [Gammaproteobacteria bacterium]|nr:hypothetical protein [Gammaproteobacteria bacterium]
MPSTRELKQSDPIRGTLRETAPVIDARHLLTGNDNCLRAASQAVGRACRKTGFFYLDHAFGRRRTFADMQQQMERFFAMPVSVKERVRTGSAPGDYGWEPLMSEPSYQPGTIAHMESLDFGFRDERNKWPDLPGFRQELRHYRETVASIAAAVLRALADSAGLDRNFFAERCQSHELNTLRLIHYPESTQNASDQDVGIAAHTDFECVTLISQTAPGLELLDVAGNWYDAPADDGTLVVILGDMLERWTNGFYKATGHRVRKTPWRRYSTVTFFAADDDVTIAPLPRFVNEATPSRYQPVRQRAHIESELARAVANRDETISRIQAGPALR